MNVKIFSIVAMLLLFASASASSFNLTFTASNSLGSLYSSYNVTAATQNALTYKNITYNGDTYLFAYYNGQPYFLINTTSGYSFVTGTSNIQSVISGTIINASINSINATYLRNSMIAYNDSSAQPITDCLLETGLNQFNATCTANNFCESCRTVPVCSQVLSATGYGSPFQIGITNFENNYTSIESNLSLYLSSTSSLSASNAQTEIPDIQKSFANISSKTSLLYQNPIFPPPASTPACNPAIPLSKQPWYCVAYGFCESLSYNSTLLGNIQNRINRINTLPILPSQVSGIAQNVTTDENKYVAIIVNTQDLKERNVILNTTLSGYNALLTNSDKLLLNISNATLTSKLNTLSANYTNLLTNYGTVNLAKLNSTLKAEYLAANTVYTSLYANYSSAIALSNNNTVLLIELESESSAPQQQVVALSFQETLLSSQLSSKISNIDSVKANLSSLNAQIKAVPHNNDISKDLSRVVGAPFASILLGSGSYSGGVALAPILSVIPAIIVSIIILAILFMFHQRLAKGRRIATNKRTARNWRILYAAVIVILIVYIVYSYFAGAAANSNAPLSAATAAISASSKVAVAINGTSNPALLSCEGKISGILQQENKTVTKITISGDACNTGSGIMTTDVCLAQYASKGTPVIILTNSSKNELSAYSFYGTILSQSGNQQFTNSCLASLFLR